MAVTQNIGLRISIGGVTEVITNIKQLEDAIGKARERLKGLEIGSSEFRNLTNEIRIAESSLKDLNKAAEGLEFEQKLEAFARVGGAITSSFAAAQAAVTLFGGDAEKVSEAAAKAQNLLTIALTARSVAEGVAGLKTVALTIKTVAQTAATAAATVATRTLYTVIAANPIGALVTVIGLAVGALLAFTNGTEEAEDSQKKFQDQLQKTSAELDFQYALLERQGATEVQLAERRLQDLQKIEKELEDNFAKEQTRNRFSEETKAASAALDEQRNKITLARQDLQNAKDKELEATRQKNADNSKKRFEERKSQIEFEIQKTQELIREEIQRNLVGQKLETPQIVLELQKRLDALKQLSEGYTKDLSLYEKYEQTFGDIGKSYMNDLVNAKLLTDQLNLLGIATGEYGDNLKGAVNTMEMGVSGIDELGNQFQDTRIEIEVLNNDLVKVGDSFVDINPKLIPFYNNLKQIEEGFAKAGTSISRIDLKNVLQQIVEFEQGGAVTFGQFKLAQEELGNFQEKFVEEYVKNNLKTREGQTGYTKDLEETTKTANVLFETIKTNQINVINFQNQLRKLQDTISLTEQIEELRKSPQLLNAFLAQNRDLITQSFSVDLEALDVNRNQILALDRIIATKQYKEAEGFQEELQALEKQFADQGIDITKASEEEKLKLLKFYLQKQVEATEDAETKKKKKQQDTISGITASIQAFQSVLNSLAQTTSQYYAFQLDLLAQQSEDIQGKIVGDSEEAVQLRLEQEKIYNEKKKQLEKQSAVTALRISLAQSLANVAESITKAFTAGPVVGQIAAGIIAGIGIAQTALIGSQISSIQSLQRGGLIRGQGGLVVGPSHEFGGVKFQGGGIELEGGEAVINRQSAVQYGGLLNQINQLGGGRPLVQNNFDDSRIVEAIAKQRSEPIRAYVVEQDITNKQGVTRRLEQLSQI